MRDPRDMLGNCYRIDTPYRLNRLSIHGIMIKYR